MKRENLVTEAQYLRGGLRAVLLSPTACAPRRLLTLLHGAGESPETLLESFDLSPWVENGLAILLPALQNSFCLDWGDGADTRSALLEELLPAAQTRCALPCERDNTLVGGISMGGFAALSLALCARGRFCAAFSLSGALDLKKAAQLLRICGLRAPGDLGKAAERPEARLEERLEEGENRPSLYLAWGDGDWFRQENRSFSQKAGEQRFPVLTDEKPGLHNWDYWKRSLGPALDWAAEVK